MLAAFRISDKLSPEARQLFDREQRLLLTFGRPVQGNNVPILAPLLSRGSLQQ